MNIPDGPHELTAEWLTQALRSTETITTARVTSFTAHAFDEEHGISGQLARLSLEYDVDEKNAPHSLVAKFHSADPETRATYRMLGMYEGEVQFYQQIASQIELRVPRCYYGDIDNGERFVLLLEDLAPAQAADTVAGCSQAEAKQAIRQIAKFHAAWWEHPQLAGMDWLLQSNPTYFRQVGDKVQTLFQQKWGQFLEKTGHTLSPPMQTLGERLIQNYVTIAEHLYLRPPQTLIHHDFQLSNLLYATPQDNAAFIVIDWQQLWLGRGTYDVAFFLCRCLSPEDRQTTEKELLNMYHTILVEQGVRDYSFEQCFYDYRLSMLDCLGRFILVLTGHLTPEMERACCDVLLPRNVAAIQALNAGELLSI